MKNQIKCLGVTLDLAPVAASSGFTSQILPHQLAELFGELAQDYPTHSEVELVRLMAGILTELYPEYSFNLAKPSSEMPSSVVESQRVRADPVDGVLTVDHLGFTLRSLQGAAAACDPTRRKWKVFLTTKQVVIGEIRLRAQPEEEEA